MAVGTGTDPARAIELDHLAVAGETLAEATAAIEEILGVGLDEGGAHEAMGTHNRLLSLGPGVYLEAISIDPSASAPQWPRWFDLDSFLGAPRLSNWIARTSNLDEALSAAPPGMGHPMRFVRGQFTWTMAVPATGRLPYEGAAPALMQWQCATHPSGVLVDRGCRLRRLHVRHPRVDTLMADFPELVTLDLVEFSEASTPSLAAEVVTPAGVRWLE